MLYKRAWDKTSPRPVSPGHEKPPDIATALQALAERLTLPPSMNGLGELSSGIARGHRRRLSAGPLL